MSNKHQFYGRPKLHRQYVKPPLLHLRGLHLVLRPAEVNDRQLYQGTAGVAPSCAGYVHRWPASSNLPEGEFACSLDSSLGRAILLSRAARLTVVTFSEFAFDSEAPDVWEVLRWLTEEFVRGKKQILMPTRWPSLARDTLAAIPNAGVWWQMPNLQRVELVRVPRDKYAAAIQSLTPPTAVPPAVKAAAQSSAV